MTAAGPVHHPTITSEGSLHARKSIIVKLLGACELADSVTQLRIRLFSLYPNGETTCYCPYMENASLGELRLLRVRYVFF